MSETTEQEPGFLEQELDTVTLDGKVVRRGKKALLAKVGWVEFSTYPQGKKIALEADFITSVSEGAEGEAILAVKSSGQPHVLIRLLDLYGPALRAVLLAREW